MTKFNSTDGIDPSGTSKNADAQKINEIGYDDASIFTIDSSQSKELLDKIYNIPKGRRAEPPSYEDYIPYEHRLDMTQYNLRIGDSMFLIPPDFIQVKSITQQSTNIGLRQMNSIKTNNGYIQKEIIISLYFNGYSQINGIQVKSPMDFPYFVDGLRPLLAQFKCAPFLPIENELLNITHGIYAVALQNFTVTTIPGFPETLKAVMVFREFNATPYIEASNVFFEDFFDWDLFRYYYQRFLVNNTRTNFKLYPSDNLRFTGEFEILSLNVDTLSGVKDISILDEENYTTILSKEDNFSVTEAAFTYSNILTNLQLSDETSPTMQYMGGMDTVFNVSIETTDSSVVAKLQSMSEALAELSRTYKDIKGVGFLKINNELYNLSGSHYAVLNELLISTVEDFPGLFKIDMQCTSFDITQNKKEDLVGFKPFDGVGGKEQTMDQNLDGLKVKIRQDLFVERRLLNIELYPDLSLPTYSEVNDAITKIRRFRLEHNLNLIAYSSYPEEPTFIPGKGVSDTYKTYVDPDFYMFYPISYGDLKDDVLSILKWPSTPKPSNFTYTKDMPSGPDYSPSDTNSQNSNIGTGAAGGTKRFLDLAISRAQLKCGYIFGASGEICTEDFIKRMQNSFGKYNDMLYSSYAKQWIGKQVFDCSGLVSWCLINMGLLKSRVNTGGLKNMYDVFHDISNLKPGDLCMKFGGSGEHVAIYMGNNQTVEAMGTKEGCVITTFNPNRFTEYGRLRCLKEATEESSIEKPQVTQQVNGIVDLSTGEWPKVNKWDNLVLKITMKSIFDPNLIKALIWVESKGDPNVTDYVTHTHWGLMQLGEAACRQVGIDPSKRLDPETNITAGVKYLEWCYNNSVHGKNVKGALWSYNGAESYYYTVWNAYMQLKPTGNGLKTGMNNIPVESKVTEETGEQVEIIKFGQGSKPYDSSKFAKPIYDLSPIDGGNYFNFSRQSDYLSTMFIDEAMYSKKGRLLKAFPTFLIMFLDSNDNWFDGRKLWTNYYVYKSVVDITITESEDPVAVATVRLTNTNHNLDTSTNIKSLSEILRNDKDLSAASRFIYKYFGSIIGGPEITKDILKYKNEIYNKINVYAGCRMHIRMGYGSNACNLPVKFNGIITEIDTQEVVTVLAQSDGAELINNAISAKENQTNSILKMQSEPSDIIAHLLCSRDSWFFNSLDKKWCEKSKYGIEHFGLFLGNQVSLDNRKIYEIFDPKKNQGFDAEYDLCKNIYLGCYDGFHFTDPGFLFDGEENINFYLFNRTPWDIMQMASQSVPEFVVRPFYHGFESRLFFGLPDWICKYQYDMVDDKIYEFGKSFAQYHFINSFGDIIDNTVRASSTGLKTNCIGTYSRGTGSGGKTLASTPLLYADRSIDWDKQKTKVVDTTVVQDYFGPDWLWEKFMPIGRSASIRVGISNIIDSFEDMYKGSVLIVGNPSIKPVDYIYLDDTFVNMKGLAFVKEVTHNFSIETGFTTEIKPGLITESAIHNAGTANKVKTLLCLGSSIGVAHMVRGAGVKLVNKVTASIATSKIVAKTKDIGKLGKSSKEAVSFAWKEVKSGNVLKDFKILFGKLKTNIQAFAKAGKLVKTTSTAITVTETTAAVTTTNVAAGAAAAGTVAFPIVGTIIAYVVVTVIMDTFLQFIVDQFSWNNCVKIYPLIYKNKPFVAGVNGQTKLIPGFGELNNDYEEDKPLKSTEEKSDELIGGTSYSETPSENYVEPDNLSSDPFWQTTT